MNNFILKTPFADLVVRSFEMADPTLLNPNSANPVIMGEFLELDANYKAARGTVSTSPNVFCFFAEQGRYDTQAIGKVPLLFINNYEADTLVFDAAAGAGISAVGQPLMVDDVTIGGIAGRRGLTALPAIPVGDEHVVGYVTRLPASNGNKLRFRRVDG